MKAIGFYRIVIPMFLGFMALAILPEDALCDETYKFERMWPATQQPWFFNYPIGIVIDASGHIYVADSGNHRIMKLSPDGALITQWGSFGEADGQFRVPRWMAIDGNGDVYVTEADTNRIQKFTANGEFIKQLGSSGSGDGQLDRVAGIAIDLGRKNSRIKARD